MTEEQKRRANSYPHTRNFLAVIRNDIDEFIRRPTLAEMNWIFTAILLGWAGVIGSGASVLFVGAILLAWVRLYQRMIAIPSDYSVLAIGATFAFYVLADAVSGAVNYDGWNTLSEVGETLPFLGFLFVYGRLSLSERADVLRAVEYGAIFGSYGTFVYVLIEFFALDHTRVEAMAGNSGVLAVICAILYGLCSLSAMRRQGFTRWLALSAIISAGASLLLTGMRALWPFLFIAPFIPLLVLRPKINWTALRRTILVVALPIAAALFLAHGLIEKRLERLSLDIEGIEQGDYDSSIGKRLVLWRTGLELASEKPIFGQGPSVMSTMESKSLGFSHFHNFLLNAMVRSGIGGVVAILGLFIVPLWVALRRRSDDISSAGVAILMIIQSAFLLSGTVGIMLGHDIHDTVFIYGTIVASFLVLGPKPSDPGTAVRQSTLKEPANVAPHIVQRNS